MATQAAQAFQAMITADERLNDIIDESEALGYATTQAQLASKHKGISYETRLNREVVAARMLRAYNRYQAEIVEPARLAWRTARDVADKLASEQLKREVTARERERQAHGIMG